MELMHAGDMSTARFWKCLWMFLCVGLLQLDARFAAKQMHDAHSGPICVNGVILSNVKRIAVGFSDAYRMFRHTVSRFSL